MNFPGHHYTADRPLPNEARAAIWRRLWNALDITEAERECRAREGMRVKDRWAAYAAARARLARIPPTDWPRIAAGMESAVEGAQGIVNRRVTRIVLRRRA